MHLLSHAEADLVTKTKAAIAAMNDLVIHLTSHPDVLPDRVRGRIVYADYMLNSAEDYFINDDDDY